MAFPYVRHQANWQDGAAGATPITEAALDTIEAGIDSLSDILELVGAKGSMIVATGDNAYGERTVGANDEVPVADSGQSTGIKWSKIGNAMIASDAAIVASKLAGYPSDSTKMLRGDGSWAAYSPTYSTYVPVWTTDGTAPSLGNGTLTGRYLQIGKMVVCNITFSAGSTTTFGTSTWFFTLPVAPSDSGGVAGTYRADDAAVASYTGFVELASSSRCYLLTPAAPGVTVTNNSPFTWGNGDSIHTELTYEAA